MSENKPHNIDPIEEVAAKPVLFTPMSLDQFLNDSYWDILANLNDIHQKKVTVEEAKKGDEAMGCQLARILMDESMGVTLQLPYKGAALIEKLREVMPEAFVKDALPAELDLGNPRVAMDYVARLFVADCYKTIAETTRRDEVTPEMMASAGRRLVTRWRQRLCGMKPAPLN